MSNQTFNDVFDRLGSLDAKVDRVLESLEYNAARGRSIDKRVRRLEGFRSRILGIVAAVSLSATVLWTILKHVLLDNK